MKTHRIIFALALTLVPWHISHAAFNQTQIDTETGQANSAVFADVNNDGRDDVLILNNGQNAVYEKNATGVFVYQEQHQLAQATDNSVDAIAADYNHDGFTDIFVVNYGTANTLYQGTANGDFVIIAEPFTQDAGFSRNATWVDVDADHDQDLVVTDSFEHVSVYINDGQGGFVKDNNHTFTNQKQQAHVVLADMDNDGDDDVLFGGKGIAVYTNNGNGNYILQEPFALAGESIHDVAVADHDSNGLPDVMVIYGMKKHVLFTQSAIGQYQATPLAIGEEMHTKMGWADMDGDSDPDLVLLDAFGKAHAEYMNDNGSYVLQPGSVLASMTGRFSDVILHDTDGDLDIDIYITNPTTGNNALLDNLADYGRLVKDGNMEQVGTAYWQPWGEPDVIQKQQADNNQFLYVQETDGGAGVQHVGIDVTAGQQYVVSFRYQFTQGERLRPIMNLRSFGNNADFEGVYQNLPKTTPGEWGWYERKIEIPGGNTEDLNVFITMRSGAGVQGSFLLDDVNVVPVDPSFVIDGDMSAPHTANWAAYGIPDLIEKRQDGSNAYLYVQETNGGAGTQQMDIPVEPGQSYVFRFRYKFEQGERLRPTLNIKGIGGKQSDIDEYYQNITKTSNNEWGWYERQFTVPAEAQHPLTVRFSMRSGADATGWFALDDVVVEPAQQSIIRDGDMEEADVASWLDYGPINIKQKHADARGGLQSLYVERDTTYAASLGIQQTQLPVEPGQQYRLSFWYKGNTMIIPRLGHNDSNEDFEGSRTYLSPQAGWQQYERTFTAPAQLDDFRLVIVVDKTYYTLRNQGPYIQLLATAANTFFLDGIETDLGPDDFELHNPLQPHVYIDDVVIVNEQ